MKRHKTNETNTIDNQTCNNLLSKNLIKNSTKISLFNNLKENSLFKKSSKSSLSSLNLSKFSFLKRNRFFGKKISSNCFKKVLP